MTCYEHIRKKNNSDPQTFKKLENYFRAIEEDKVEEYHKRRGRPDDKKLF